MIFLKKANFSDIEFLWYLRNQPDVYQYSRQNRAITWEEHLNWIIPIILGMKAKSLFIVQQKSLPVGQIRFDYEKDKEAEISISILKEFKGKGLGRESFKKALQLLKKEKKVKTIVAEVHKDNIPSQKFFEKLNFKFKEKRRNWLEYIWEMKSK